ncbi:NAD-dependent malic enzyme [Photobacterium sp. SDRW27]|uniref:NAD-dependent malic enzyme n=1 Tax=Photobacterium obscurum TaxID=2829490 RepID=UPI0022433E01|nr:NAD-dependent malic enzyme [Photobacterium obscurum]MCW8330981.1 NAD-dependent malic enzyme [Photobacterium obscurum]
MYENNKTLYLPYAGPTLLENALLNKGSAFSLEERQNFSLIGLLPATIESITEQEERAYSQFQTFSNDLDKHIFLRNIQDTNETLYYRLIENHIEEMMPIIYTPTVGAACEKFSNIYRRGRGLFLTYPERGNMVDTLNNAARQDVKIVVITDGERILGLGDQGIGGMGIPIGKLALYTACGGINPANTLPIVLDVGTNNTQLLSDPMYMGWRHPRVTGQEYDDFVEEVIQAIKSRWPNALIQFEDFAQKNAMPLLNRYKNKVCCFNDDIQGTAAVTVGSLLAACKAAGSRLSEQRITFVGAGSAGCGIAEAIIAQMVAEGLSDSAARERIFMVDRWGLLTDDMQNLLSFQQKLTQKTASVSSWNSTGSISLLDVISHAKPTVLIGVSGVPGLFSQEVISEMHAHCSRPIVLPLSNPTSRVEATPSDILRWTEGNALIATGSPFEPVIFDGKTFPIAQCNNSYIFPGIGLGVLASGATRVTDEMLMASSRALAECSPLAQFGEGNLLPPLEEIHQVSRHIALAVAKKAIEQQTAPQRTDEQLLEKIESTFWEPEYLKYKRTAL